MQRAIVVYTSDHGELFGEHGCYGHNSPACPALTYVPTVFVYESTTTGDLGPNRTEDVIEHVDIVETASSALGLDEFRTMGQNVVTDQWSSKPGYTHKSTNKYGRTMYEVDGLWWYDGGHTFIENSKINLFLYAVHKLARSGPKKQLRRNSLNVIETFLKGDTTYGTPPETRTEAKELLDVIRSDIDSRQSQRLELTDEEKEQLRDLGYWT